MSNKNILQLFLLILLSVNYSFAIADEMSGDEKLLTEDEIDDSLGQYGEARDTLDISEIRDTAKLMFMTDHLSNVTKPSNIYYEWVTRGKNDPGFTDSVYLSVLDINEDGTKNTDIEFFTGPRQFRNYSPDIAMNVRGNPILNIYLSGSVYNMMKLIEKGTFNYYQRQMRDSIGLDATLESTTFTFEGKQYNGEKVTFIPFIKDKRSAEYKPYSHKVYEIVFSKDIPGQLYEIRSFVPDLDNPESEQPFIFESLVFKSIKSQTGS